MNAADLFGIGGTWTRAWKTDITSPSPATVVADAPLSAGAVTVNSAENDAAAISAIRERLRTAGTSLRDALAQFTRETRPVYTTYAGTVAAAEAIVQGMSAGIDDAEMSYQVLAATDAVNTTVSTARTSSAALGLDVTTPNAKSTIASTAEMNTTVTTSYGSGSLTFRRGGSTSSSVGSLSGTYTGTGVAANATSLTFEITRGDTIGGLLGLGEGNIDFRVKDQAGTVLFTYSGALGTNEAVYLGDDIGLTLRFSAGQLTEQHTATTTVTKTPTTVSTTAAFNASAALRPQFDGGRVVTAGSFSINGTTIAVNASDSISSVLSRINASAAGVTAAASGDKITLTTNSYSEAPIVLANDTSGFLNATKLLNATSTAGNVRDDQQTFSTSTQFSGVATGSFRVNGVTISVNSSTDSLATVLARVNASSARVTATYDSVTDRVTFTPNREGDTLTLADDTSGLLSALHIAEGTAASEVDIDAAFNTSPGFDLGLAVTAGSFTINGVSIAVAETDSISTVLARITASAAGVTASYDEDSGAVRLTATQYGTDPITTGGDTSGFLAATKLYSSTVHTTNPELVSALNTPVKLIAEYNGVKSGTLTINGHDIEIDPRHTSVVSLVESINALEGVGAWVNTQNGEIQIWSEEADGALTLADTSRLLDALGIATGTYATASEDSPARTLQTGTTTVTNAANVADEAARALTAINDVVAELQKGRSEDAGFNRDVEETLASAVDLLRIAGVRGVSVAGEDSALSLALSRDGLIGALETLRADADLARGLAGLADTLDAGFAAAAGWDGRAGGVWQTIELEETSRAQLANNQAQLSLLLSGEPKAAVDGKAAVKAYGG